VAKIGSDFGQRDEDEVALKHAQMRDVEARCIDDGVIVEQDVEVDEAGAVGEWFAAAHVGFNAAESRKKLVGGEAGGGLEDSVEEPGLVEVVDGFRLVEAGEFDDSNGGVFEELNSAAKVGFTIANVGAEREVDGGHAESL
jgi:hypothetical protein